jgi:hypothetical protein
MEYFQVGTILQDQLLEKSRWETLEADKAAHMTGSHNFRQQTKKKITSNFQVNIKKKLFFGTRKILFYYKG